MWKLVHQPQIKNAMSSQFFRASNYESICPYCLCGFVANHAIRRYCAEKNGVLNYCKNRFDNQIKHLIDAERNNMYVRSNTKEEYQRLYNIQVLSNLYKEGFTSLTDDELLKLKYDMFIYDWREVLVRDPFFKINIGPFQLEWKVDQIISITKK